MDRSQARAILGVDGGGTSTKAIAIDSYGRLIGAGISGPSNPNNTDAKTAATSILAAIDAALSSNPIPIASACFGIAGVATESIRSELESALLEQRPALANAKLYITHDLEIAHQAAFDENPGIVLIAGTGSACYARDASGKIHRVSGRSYSHEDPGSGYAIGKRAIESMLLPPAQARDAIAALAKQVIEMAETGNSKAREILEVEAAHLVELTKSISGNLPIALIGSIIESNTLFRTLLIDALAARFEKLHLTIPSDKPEIGALQIAWKQVSDQPLKLDGF